MDKSADSITATGSVTSLDSSCYRGGGVVNHGHPRERKAGSNSSIDLEWENDGILTGYINNFALFNGLICDNIVVTYLVS